MEPNCTSEIFNVWYAVLIDVINDLLRYSCITFLGSEVEARRTFGKY